MKKFKVTADIDIRHNGDVYRQGDIIELEKKEAERLKSYITVSKKSRGGKAEGVGEEKPASDEGEKTTESETEKIEGVK